LQKINWQFSGCALEAVDQKSNELLWAIADSQEDLKQSWPKAGGDIISAFSSETDGLKVEVGFQQVEGEQLVKVYSYWDKAPVSSFERRWVYTKVAKRLLQQFNLRKFVLFFSSQSSGEANYLPNDLVGVMDHPYLGCPETFQIRVFCDKSLLHLGSPQQEVMCHYAFQYRHWVNEDPETMTSLEIGKRLKIFAENYGCSFQEFDQEELIKQRMNLLVAVGRASEDSPPRFFILTANLANGVGEKPLALVGKGITFDTGGINVKPYESHVHCMRNDMGGAALMANTFMGLIKNGYDKPIVLAIPSCENLVSSRSMRPGSIFKARSGKTVQVEHTDAEGRLILADALSYVSDQFNPAQTVSAATLTTAALRQFSNYFTAVHFADASQQKLLTELAARYGEKFTFWDSFLPFAAGNESSYSDLTNMGRLPRDAAIGGGSNVAAHFLKEFVAGSFLHFDIFASTWNWSGDYPGCAAGATGAMMYPLYEFLLQSTS